VITLLTPPVRDIQLLVFVQCISLIAMGIRSDLGQRSNTLIDGRGRRANRQGMDQAECG
jgi:hypothetical protein